MASVDWGDVPTWVTSTSIFFAVLTLLQTHQRERRERQQEHDRQKRERQQQQEEHEQERRRQATLVSLKMTYPKKTNGTTQSSIEVENPSPEPVYRVKAKVMARVRRVEPSVIDEIPICVEWATIAGTSPVKLAVSSAKKYGVVEAIPDLDDSAWSHSWCMWFTDFRGTRWEKCDTGAMHEVDAMYEMTPCDLLNETR
jgi:hypothetical protein